MQTFGKKMITGAIGIFTHYPLHSTQLQLSDLQENFEELLKTQETKKIIISKIQQNNLIKRLQQTKQYIKTSTTVPQELYIQQANQQTSYYNKNMIIQNIENLCESLQMAISSSPQVNEQELWTYIQKTTQITISLLQKMTERDATHDMILCDTAVGGAWFLHDVLKKLCMQVCSQEGDTSRQVSHYANRGIIRIAHYIAQNLEQTNLDGGADDNISSCIRKLRQCDATASIEENISAVKSVGQNPHIIHSFLLVPSMSPNTSDEQIQLDNFEELKTCQQKTTSDIFFAAETPEEYTKLLIHCLISECITDALRRFIINKRWLNHTHLQQKRTNVVTSLNFNDLKQEQEARINEMRQLSIQEAPSIKKIYIIVMFFFIKKIYFIALYITNFALYRIVKYYALQIKSIDEETGLLIIRNALEKIISLLNDDSVRKNLHKPEACWQRNKILRQIIIIGLQNPLQQSCNPLTRWFNWKFCFNNLRAKIIVIILSLIVRHTNIEKRVLKIFQDTLYPRNNMNVFGNCLIRMLQKYMRDDKNTMANQPHNSSIPEQVTEEITAVFKNHIADMLKILLKRNHSTSQPLLKEKFDTCPMFQKLLIRVVSSEVADRATSMLQKLCEESSIEIILNNVLKAIAINLRNKKMTPSQTRRDHQQDKDPIMLDSTADQIAQCLLECAAYFLNKKGDKAYDRYWQEECVKYADIPTTIIPRIIELIQDMQGTLSYNGMRFCMETIEKYINKIIQKTSTIPSSSNRNCIRLQVRRQASLYAKDLTACRKTARKKMMLLSLQNPDIEKQLSKAIDTTSQEILEVILKHKNDIYNDPQNCLTDISRYLQQLMQEFSRILTNMPSANLLHSEEWAEMSSWISQILNVQIPEVFSRHNSTQFLQHLLQRINQQEAECTINHNTIDNLATQIELYKNALHNIMIHFQTGISSISNKQDQDTLNDALQELLTTLAALGNFQQDATVANQENIKKSIVDNINKQLKKLHDKLQAIYSSKHEEYNTQSNNLFEEINGTLLKQKSQWQYDDNQMTKCNEELQNIKQNLQKTIQHDEDTFRRNFKPISFLSEEGQKSSQKIINAAIHLYIRAEIWNCIPNLAIFTPYMLLEASTALLQQIINYRIQ